MKLALLSVAGFALLIGALSAVSEDPDSKLGAFLGGCATVVFIAALFAEHPRYRR